MTRARGPPEYGFDVFCAILQRLPSLQNLHISDGIFVDPDYPFTEETPCFDLRRLEFSSLGYGSEGIRDFVRFLNLFSEVDVLALKEVDFTPLSDDIRFFPGAAHTILISDLPIYLAVSDVRMRDVQTDFQNTLINVLWETEAKVALSSIKLDCPIQDVQDSLFTLTEVVGGNLLHLSVSVDSRVQARESKRYHLELCV